MRIIEDTQHHELYHYFPEIPDRFRIYSNSPKDCAPSKKVNPSKRPIKFFACTAMILTALVCDAYSNHTLPDSSTQPCSNTTQDTIKDAAISYYLRAGEAFRLDAKRGRCAGIGGEPCVNPFPYSTIDEFKSANPKCCEILDYIPGDEPKSYRKNIRGEALPKMYLVKIVFKAKMKSRGSPETSITEYTHREILTIDCSGNVMRGDVD